MEPTMDPKLIAQTLNFHGQQLQKIWDGEREGELAKLNVTDLDFAVYQERQKQLSFQDRTKRLKLQQFLVKKANVLFDSSCMDVTQWGGQGTSAGAGEEDYYAIMPPYETFLRVDKATRTRYFYQCLQRGDTIIATITNKQVAGFLLKVLYVEGDNPRYTADLSIKAFCSAANIPPSLDKKNGGRGILSGDTIRAEVMEVHPDSEKIMCTLKGAPREGAGDGSPSATEGQPRLGLIRTEEYPEPLNICNYKDNTVGFVAKRNRREALLFPLHCANPPPTPSGEMVVAIDKNRHEDQNHIIGRDFSFPANSVYVQDQ